MSILDNFLNRLRLPDAEADEEYNEQAEDFYNAETGQYTPRTGVRNENQGVIHHGLNIDLNQQYTALDDRYDTGDSDSVQTAGQSVQNCVQTTVQADGQPVQDDTESVQMIVHGQDWTHRASRNGQKYRPVWSISTLLNIVMLLCMVALTYAGYPLAMLICGYTFLFGFFLLTDPIQCFERFLANKSRWLLSITIILILIAYTTANIRVWTATAILDGVFIFLTYFCNKKWMIQETVETSIAMERAMCNDPNGNAQKAWNAYGWKQVLTMLHELGFSIPREELLGWVACVYQLGFIHSQKKNAFGEEMKEKAQTKIAEQEKKIKSLKEIYPKYDQLEREKIEKEREVAHLQDTITKMEDQIKHYKQQYDLIKAENEKLKATNEEIINSVGTSEDIISFEEESEERQQTRIYELLDAGKSIRQTAEIIGIPKWKVEKAKKEREGKKAVNE